MKAIVITRPGDLDSLEVREVATPEAGGDLVRVRVRACGLNRADLLQAKGQYPSPTGYPTEIPGLEFAGEVETLGSSVGGPLKVGDRVFGITGGGAFAEFVTCPAGMLARIPDDLDFEQAAAVPEAFMTALDALETQGQARPGDRVLIHAVGGGVGSAAVQVARAMGCEVFGTSRTVEKLEKCQPLGLDVPIHASGQDFAEVIRDRTNGIGVAVVIDFLGASALLGNVASLRIGGRLVLVGQLGGSKTEFDFRPLMTRRITVVGTTLRARPIEEKITLTKRFAGSVVPWLERGVVKPVVDQVYAFEDIRSAAERMSSNLGFGKVILRLV
jgi:putative PIG3 family NAD(P)H quinone oxidoreductase